MRLGPFDIRVQRPQLEIARFACLIGPADYVVLEVNQIAIIDTGLIRLIRQCIVSKPYFEGPQCQPFVLVDQLLANVIDEFLKATSVLPFSAAL